MRDGISIDLKFIGHKAEKLQNLFKEYSFEPNEYGAFLRFENYSMYVVNKGVTCYTNCFENDEHFYEVLHTKLLMNL